MKDWWDKNSKWVATTLTILGLIGGYILGVYKTTLEYDTKVETININIQNIKDDVHDINTIIQNKVLTK